MWNTLAYNVAICPFPFRNNEYHGCTIPGTSNRIADTSDNQSGFFSRAGSNNFIGNRASNHFNGMFLNEGGIGRGESYNKVCESASQLGRMDGNTWHGNGRFGTYTLGFNYPKVTDQSPANNGYNTDKSSCDPFDSNGDTQGLSGSFVNHVDYGNAFVGHYSAGDIQHYGHHSTENNELIYWKETKTFENGCGAHIVNAYYAKGNLALPDQSTFIIENTVLGEDVMMEANHHCNVGTTGVLCMPTYVMHKVQWKNHNMNRRWAWFQSRSVQPHNNDQNHGGIFTLSPVDAAVVQSGGVLEDSFFPQGYVSLVSDRFSYLLGLPNNLCFDSSTQYGDRYNGGILCKTELRALKIYTRGLLSGSAPSLRVEVWYNSGGVGGQNGAPNTSQLVGFHQVGSDYASRKQGYSIPVIPGRGHSYRLSLTNGDLPGDWVIEFSDPVIGNRWSRDELYLSVVGRNCGNNGLISSQHDRKYIWGGNGYLDEQAWFNHGACVGSGNQPPEDPPVDCDARASVTSNRKLRGSSTSDSSALAGIIDATHCPGDCPGGCDNANSYCDCGSKTCQCKAGFVGPNCETDLCGQADCGEHGSCAARYLGGDLPVTDQDKKCICEGTWRGDKCERNPCEELNFDCSGRGDCAALSDTEATCECQDGYFGPFCEQRSPCEGFCQSGSFPYFGCGSDIGGKVALGCFRTGGCYYLNEGQDYPYDGFCTYKIYGVNTVFSTENGGGPVVQPPTPAPVQLPAPTPASPRCGCESCTESVWNTLADGYTCGGRISFARDSDVATLQSVGINNGPLDEAGACRLVTEEFPDICTCTCDADTSSPTLSPTPPPTSAPTSAPMSVPTSSPTTPQTSSPTVTPTVAPMAAPTVAPPAKCGCTMCTDEVWNTVVDGYSCGARVSFVRDSDTATLESVGIFTGPFDEAGACSFVSDEFPEVCTFYCDKDEDPPVAVRPTVAPTTSPTTTFPTSSPTTDSPTASPIDLPTMSPTLSPTLSPTPPPTTTLTTDQQECVDSPLNAKINNRQRGCDWIVNTDKCPKQKFWRHCRASCYRCNQCKDSKLNFTASIDGTNRHIKCAKDVDLDDETRDRLCADQDIALTCPKTCGVC